MDYMQCLLELYKGTKRQGPGSDEATLRALSMIKLPENPSIADIGCGSGTQTLTVMKAAGGSMIAVDIFGEFLNELKSKAADAGLSDGLITMKADMNDLSIMNGSLDCIWSEGAVYIMGFENGIKEWRRLLKHDGYLVVSELTFIKPQIPSEVLDYWKSVYPAVDTTDGNIRKAEKAGYKVIGTFILENAAWEEFYKNTRKRLSDFKKKYTDETAVAVAAETETEIMMFDKYSEFYSYVFYILQKK